MYGRRAASLLFLVLVFTALPLAAADILYSVSRWSCGLIVWDGEMPEQAAEVTLRLEEAVTQAFGFWGYPPPVALAECKGSKCVRIPDPATGELIRAPALSWQGRETYPVVVVMFPDRKRMLLALGGERNFGAIWLTQPLSRLPIEGVEPWIESVASSYRTMITPMTADDGIWIHEFAHWFTYQWCYPQGVWPYLLPNYIKEGMAEAARFSVAEPEAAKEWHARAAEWAASNCLTGSCTQRMMYPVGLSLVSYLVRTLGAEGLLASLSGWMSRASAMIDRYESGWRVSLGLPSICVKYEPMDLRFTE